jgi:hypothetical protein
LKKVLGAALVVGVLMGTSLASTPDERIAAAQRRLEERQRAAKEAAARAATQPAAATRPATTRPAGAGKASKKVVFVIDASGSMNNKLADVQAEVGKALSGLQPDQQFGIIAYMDNRAIPFKPALLPATDANKAAAWEYVSTQILAAGTGDPTSAIQAAAKLRPDVVWVLTDGDFGDPDAAIAETTKAAKAAGCRVNTTTLFLTDPENDNVFSPALRRMATATGGVCVGPDGKPLPPLDGKPVPPPPQAPPAGPSILQDQ